jgi:four helix bundle protein
MNQFKNLLVWQKSLDLVIEVYKLTDDFPNKEQFGLTSQINRCAVSVASNIAEGAGRNSEKEFNNFLGIAVGSLCELETQLIIAQRLKYITEIELENLNLPIREIEKMIYALKKSLLNTFEGKGNKQIIQKIALDKINSGELKGKK